MSGLLSSVATAVIDAHEKARQGVSMQDVFAATTDNSEAKRVARLSDFFGQPLSEIHLTVEAFDAHFPSLRELGAAPLPGADRAFWDTRNAYRKWREVVRRRLRDTTGERAADEALRAREDGRSALLRDLAPLAEEDGPMHPASLAAVRALADRARAAELEPSDLDPSRVAAFLDGQRSDARARSIKALKTLDRFVPVSQVRAHFPEGFSLDEAAAGQRTHVPDEVREMIAQLVDTARYDDKAYDDISQTTTATFNDATAATYRAALVALARAAADAGVLQLRGLNSLGRLFDCDVRKAAVNRWSDQVAAEAGFSARSAAQYARSIAQIGAASGFDTAPWVRSLKLNAMLREGRENAKKMSPGNRGFCEGLIQDPRKTRSFLSLHVRFQERAGDLLATDKPLSGSALRQVRMLGSCAAFAAIELRGAGVRKGSALAAQSHGPDQNPFRRRIGDQRRFELRIAKKDMKGEYTELPPIPIRDDRYCGYALLDWYLSEIRPLFPFANREWCSDQNKTMSPWLFPAEQSAGPLRGGPLHTWICRASELAELPMTPHNFRHGTATLLLARSWSNRERAATYLGCSLSVLDTYYAWIDRLRKIEEVQDLLAEALNGIA